MVVLMVVVGTVVLVMVVRVWCKGTGGGGGSVEYRSVGGGLCRSG